MPKMIKIPFKDRFAEPLKSGVKTMTSRTKVYGQPGDYFFAFGDCYVLTSVIERHLDFIVDHWKEEGCSSREDFLGVWREIHPRKALNMQDMFWTHSFLEISLYTRTYKKLSNSDLLYFLQSDGANTTNEGKT
jgi:hypothetical protein